MRVLGIMLGTRIDEEQADAPVIATVALSAIDRVDVLVPREAWDAPGGVAARWLGGPGFLLCELSRTGDRAWWVGWLPPPTDAAGRAEASAEPLGPVESASTLPGERSS